MSRIIAPFGITAQVNVAGLSLDFKGGVAEVDVSAQDARRLRAQGFTVDTAEPASAPATTFLAPGEDDRPARNASKSDWVEYAVLRGHQEGSLEELTRDQIRDLFAE
jgi:hypothetical protein